MGVQGISSRRCAARLTVSRVTWHHQKEAGMLSNCVFSTSNSMKYKMLEHSTSSRISRKTSMANMSTDATNASITT